MRFQYRVSTISPYSTLHIGSPLFTIEVETRPTLYGQVYFWRTNRIHRFTSKQSSSCFHTTQERSSWVARHLSRYVDTLSGKRRKVMANVAGGCGDGINLDRKSGKKWGVIINNAWPRPSGVVSCDRFVAAERFAC